MDSDFLDALASLDFKLSVTESVSDSPFFTASASTGLSELFIMDTKAKQAKGSIRKSTLAQIMVLYLSQGYHSAMV